MAPRSEGALFGYNLNGPDSLAIRVALDVWGLALNPPQAGNAAIWAALKEVLIGAGLWPASRTELDR